MDKIDPEVKYLLELLDSLTEDQLATAHLMLSYYAQLQFVLLADKIYVPQLYTYLKRVSTFLKEIRLKRSKEWVSHYGTRATYALAQIIKDIFEIETPHRVTYNSIKILKIIEQLLRNYHKVFGDKTFKEYFDDISFSYYRIFSRKAALLIMLALSKDLLQDSEEDEEERMERLRKKVEFYTENLSKLKTSLENLSDAKFLVFHSISLLICRNYLDFTKFVKYRKHVLRSIKTYILTSGDKTNKNSMLALKTAVFPKITESVIVAIDKGYQADNPLTQRFEWFTIATEILLQDAIQMKSEEANKMIFELRRDKEDVYTNPKFEGYALTYIKAAKQELEKLNNLSAKSNTCKQISKETLEPCKLQSPDNETVLQRSLKETEFRISGDEEFLTDSLKSITKRFHKLNCEHALWFHTCAIGILNARGIPDEFYQSYKSSALKAISAYKNSEDISLVKSSRKNVDKEFRKLYRAIYKQINSEEQRGDPYEIVSWLVTATALDLCFEEVLKMRVEMVEIFLYQIEYIQKLENFRSETLYAYVLKYLIKSERIIKETYVID